jgi:hypothetical protein
MPHIIKLPIRSFSVIKHTRTRGDRAMEDLNSRNDLRWVNQIRSLNVGEPKTPAEMATLMIEYGANLSFSNMWEAMFDGENLFKQHRNKKFILQVDLALQDNIGNLHSDSGAAFISGEEEFFFLHGLNLGSENAKWVTTPAEKLDPQEILAIPNVDLRREMIRKKGIEQLLDGLFSRILDTQGNYTLYSVLLGRDTASACNFLKMLNPSIGVWHMEGVPNNIRTVRDALLWRNNGWFEHAEDIT